MLGDPRNAAFHIPAALRGGQGSNFNTWRETLRFRNVSGGLRGSETPPGGLRTVPGDPQSTAFHIPAALRGGQGDPNFNT